MHSADRIGAFPAFASFLEFPPDFSTPPSQRGNCFPRAAKPKDDHRLHKSRALKQRGLFLIFLLLRKDKEEGGIFAASGGGDKRVERERERQ